jgi:hypothetical protein
LFTVDREGFPKLTGTLLTNESAAGSEIATVLITLMRVPRSQPSYRQQKLGYDDDFDRGVRALLKRYLPVGASAHAHLLDTDPTYRPAR